MADRPRRTTLLRDEANDYTRATKDASPKTKTSAEQAEEQRKKDIVTEALRRFRLIVEEEDAQRKREVEDLRFDRGFVEDQWPADVLSARKGGIAPDGTVMHARPCLVINKLDQPVQQIISEARKARLAITIKPKGAKANQEGAELRQGMIRAIETDSRANLARVWALERAVKCGRGAYRILKTYANDGDFDLDLIVARIKNQGSVYLDPFANEPDWSDGEYAFITDDMPVREYKRLYGDSALASMSAAELTSISDQAKGWVTQDNDEDGGTIRVAEYFYVEWVKRLLIQDPATGENRLLPEGDPLPAGIVNYRPVEQRQVRWCVINATEVLDEEDWDGRFIPIIPVIGKEYNVDGQASYKGVVSNGKDAQRLYNYARSSQALRAGLESLAPWVLADGQDEGYEAMWDQANTRAFTRLIYKPTTFEGHLLPPPQRNDLSSTNITTALMMAREADGDIQATTGRYNPSLGKQDSNRSGKAIERLQKQGEAGSSSYLENLAAISMSYEGRVLLDLLPKVYDRPGRIVRLLGDDPRDERQVVLRQPFIEGPQGPLPTTPGTPGLISTVMNKLRGKPPEAPKLYDLSSDGDYTVVVTIGQAYATQMEADRAFLLGVMQAAPQTVPYLMDIAAGLEGTRMGDQVKKRFQQINPALKDPEEGGEPPIPPQVQQQMAQMQQQLQAATAEIQRLQQEAAAQVPKVRSAERMKQAELASQERIAAAKIRADLTKTQAELGSKEGVETMKVTSDQQAHHADLLHERQMTHEEAALEDHAARRDAALQPKYPPLKAEKVFEPNDVLEPPPNALR